MTLIFDPVTLSPLAAGDGASRRHRHVQGAGGGRRRGRHRQQLQRGADGPGPRHLHQGHLQGRVALVDGRTRCLHHLYGQGQAAVY